MMCKCLPVRKDVCGETNVRGKKSDKNTKLPRVWNFNNRLPSPALPRSCLKWHQYLNTPDFLREEEQGVLLFYSNSIGSCLASSIRVSASVTSVTPAADGQDVSDALTGHEML